jgi:predicted RNase H-like HicB family nuclease
MLSDYINSALSKAEYKKLEDGDWFAEIPGFDGIWANAENVEACRAELIEVLENWILVKLSDRDTLPETGVEIGVKRAQVG